MNAQTTIETVDEATVIKRRLARARDLALNSIAQMPHGWTRDANALLAEVAGYMSMRDAPLPALQDALELSLALVRVQNLCGMLEGEYPTDRYEP